MSPSKAIDTSKRKKRSMKKVMGGERQGPKGKGSVYAKRLCRFIQRYEKDAEILAKRGSEEGGGKSESPE